MIGVIKQLKLFPSLLLLAVFGCSESARQAPVGSAVPKAPVVRAVPAPVPAGAQELDCTHGQGDVARVGQATLTAQAFCAELKGVAGVLQPGASEAMRTQATALLEQWVDATLIRRALEADNAVVPPAEVDQALAQLTAAEGVAPPQAELAHARRQLEHRLALRKLLELRARIEVTAAEVEAEVASHAQTPRTALTARPYIARLPPEPTPEADQLAQKSAEEFVAAARQGPAEPAARANRLVSMRPFELTAGGLEPQLERAAATLKPGEFSAPVRTRAGWVVLELTRRREGPPAPLSHVRGEILQKLQGRRRVAEQARILAELRAQSRVEVLARW